MFEKATDVCPFSMGGSEKSCIKERCKAWVSERVFDPSNGQSYDRHDCSFLWLRINTHEAVRVTRELGAALESLRNVSIDNASMVAAGMASGLGEVLAKRLEKRDEQPDKV